MLTESVLYKSTFSLWHSDKCADCGSRHKSGEAHEKGDAETVLRHQPDRVQSPYVDCPVRGLTPVGTPVHRAPAAQSMVQHRRKGNPMGAFSSAVQSLGLVRRSPPERSAPVSFHGKHVLKQILVKVELPKTCTEGQGFLLRTPFEHSIAASALVLGAQPDWSANGRKDRSLRIRLSIVLHSVWRTACKPLR